MMQTFLLEHNHHRTVAAVQLRSLLAKLLHILTGIYIHSIRTKEQVSTFESVELRTTWFSSIAEESKVGIFKGARGISTLNPLGSPKGSLSTCFPVALKMPPFVTFLQSNTKHTKGKWCENCPWVRVAPPSFTYSPQKPSGFLHNEPGQQDTPGSNTAVTERHVLVAMHAVRMTKG